jgi:uncharacterized lipoprotein YehR (DUF1307 family)
MKRFISVLMITILCVSLTGCGDTKTKPHHTKVLLSTPLLTQKIHPKVFLSVTTAKKKSTRKTYLTAYCGPTKQIDKTQ